MSKEVMTDIVISLYNYEKYIRDCIESCLANKGTRIILVDDCSTDGGLEIAKKYKDEIKIIELKENRGVSHARNVGLRNTSHEYIQLLDADDMLTPESIKHRAEYLDTHDRDIVAGPCFKVRDDRSYEECINTILPLHPSDNPICAFLFRRKVFEEFGLFNERLRSKEDKAFFYKVGIHRNSRMPRSKFKKIDFAAAIVRRHGDSKRKKRAKNLDFEIRTNLEFDKYMKGLELNGIQEELL